MMIDVKFQFIAMFPHIDRFTCFMLRICITTNCVLRQEEKIMEILKINPISVKK